MDLTWASATQMNLYHVYTDANPNAVTASATIWDDPVQTYHITSSEVSESTTVQVDEAPLSSVPASNITSFFDVSDPENLDTSPRAVAQFADANPYAEPDDFTVVSIDWGDGSPIDYGAGSVQKDPNGNFDVMGYHPYFAPNPDPASDGSYLVHAVVMEPTPGGGSGDGEFVDAYGKAFVHAKLWINATAGTTPPAQKTGVDCSNANITIKMSSLPPGATSWSGPINLEEFAGSPPPPAWTKYTDVAWVGTPTMRVVSSSVVAVGGISWLPAAAATGTPASVWVENMTVTGIGAGSKFTLMFSDASGAQGTVTISFV